MTVGTAMVNCRGLRYRDRGRCYTRPATADLRAAPVRTGDGSGASVIAKSQAL
jgi:hypothetical protein